MRLAPGEIALWTVALDGPGAPELLSPEERARADAAVRPELRRRRICARSALRRILGAYLAVDPATVAIVTGEHGKPRLAQGPAFNLSHTEDLMLVAVADRGEVGVDVELRGRLDKTWRNFARRSFSPGEMRQLEAAPLTMQAEAALRVWVRKEAYAKARGAGFAYGFPSFTVRIEEGDSANLLEHDANDPAAATAWRLCDVKAPPAFYAACAHAAGGGPIRHRELSELNR